MGFLRRGRTGGAAHNGGLGQVGLSFPDIAYDVWAIDVMKQSLGFFPATASATNWPALISSDGLPTAMPSAGNWRVSQLYFYGVANDVWVLDWTTASGSATIALTSAFAGGSITESIISGTRREYTIVGSPQSGVDGLATPGGLAKVDATISALSGTLTSLRLYRKTDEALLGGGGATAIFTSEYLTRTAPFGSLRFMDWARCNEGRTYNWSYRRPDTHFTQAGPLINSAWYYGTATSTAPLNIFTVSTLPTLTNGLPVQFLMSARPNKLDVTAVTKGNPTQFTITAHGLAGGELLTGDQGADGGGSWQTTFRAKNTTTGLPPEFVVTRIDADTISLPFDSTAFANPGTIALIPSIRITDGVVSKRVYRRGLVTHFYSEFGGKTYPFLYTAVYDAKFDCFIMSGDGGGDVFNTSVSLSYMVALANYSRSHPWFAIPFFVDDDYWTQHATAVKATLSTGLKPRWEPGNEVWNTATAFPNTPYAQSSAAKDGLNTGFGVVAWNLAYAKRFNEACDLVEAVYGTGDDWMMILGTQLTDISADRLQGNASINGGGSAGYPANRADAIASAPYISPIFAGSAGNSVNYPGLLDQIDNYNQGGASRDTAFAWLSAEMETASTLGWKAGPATLDDEIARVASRQSTLTTAGYTGRRGTGLPQIHYEGGPTQTAGSSFTSAGYPANAPISGRSVTYANLQSFWVDWLSSTQAATFMRSHFTRMASAGIIFPAQYVVAGYHTSTYNQGLYKINNVTASATPAFTELLNWNNGL
jgi:hypothetical protein